MTFDASGDATKLRADSPDIPASLMTAFRSRLRRPPPTVSVAHSLPVLFFGDALSAGLLTVGLNPSDQEYVDPSGRELEGDRRRFHTLNSLRATSRTELTDFQCDRAIQAMRDYFNPGRPVFGWFKPLSRVVMAMGANFVERTAAHLDLVQESTHPVWSGLTEQDRSSLLKADRTFLLWQLTVLPARVVVCNGASVLAAVLELTHADVFATGSMRRIRWTLAEARIGADRGLSIAGWNYPLTRPTGLGAIGEQELGHELARRLDAHVPRLTT